MRAQLHSSSCPELGQWASIYPVQYISEQIDAYSTLDVPGQILSGKRDLYPAERLQSTRVVKEGRQLIKQFSLPNIIDEEQKLSKLQWQRLVKRTIYEAYGNYLTCVIASSSKLRDGPMVGE